MKKFQKLLCCVLAICLAVMAMPQFSTLANAPVIVPRPEPAPVVEAPAYPLENTTVILYSGNLRGNIYVLPQMVALRDAFTAQGAEVVMVDTGNFLQGTIYATYDSGSTVIDLMNQAGYDVVAIGSHDFAFGTGIVGVETHGILFAHDSLGYLLEAADFEAIASNIMADNAPLFAPTAVVETQSNRHIAFFGITNPLTANYVLESTLDGLTFFAANAVAHSHAAFFAQTADLTIGLSNTGETLVVPGAIMLDVYAGAGLTVGALVVCNDTNQVLSHSLVNPWNVEAAYELAEAVAIVAEIVHEAFPEGTVAVAEVALGGTFAASRSGETTLGNLWTDALRWFALEGGIEGFFDEDDIAAGNTGIMVDPENVVAIWNGGNLRDFLNTGHVTRMDLQRVLPFPNRVAVMYLTGAQLLEMLEAATQGMPFTSDTFSASAAFPHVAGIEFTIDTTIPFDAGEAYGNHWFRANSLNRVTINSINGQDFDPAATYAIITSNAIFNGMDSNYISLERCDEFSTITSALVVDVVWMYISQVLGGVIGDMYATTQGRITVQ